jgi:hypothetical protein
MENIKKSPAGQKNQGSCESCEFFDYDEEWDEYVCSISLDEDEMIDFLGRNTGRCPYYRFYDEYKSVRKQN